MQQTVAMPVSQYAGNSGNAKILGEQQMVEENGNSSAILMH